MVDITDWAYIAGCIDGEGCLSFNISSKVTVQITIVNTDKKMIDFINRVCNKAEIKMGIHYRDPRKAMFKGRIITGVKKCWGIYPTSFRDKLSFLELVFPYLIIKQEKANLLIEELKHRLEKRNLSSTWNPWKLRIDKTDRSLYERWKQIG